MFAQQLFLCGGVFDQGFSLVLSPDRGEGGAQYEEGG